MQLIDVGRRIGGSASFRLQMLEIALLQPNCGCGGTGRLLQRTVVDVVELDGGPVRPCCGVAIEDDGVVDFLRSRGEADRRRPGCVIGRGEQNVGHICGGVGSIVVEPPDTETRAPLSVLETRVGRRFSHGSTPRKHHNGGERWRDYRTAAVAYGMQRNGYRPGA